MAAAHKIPLWPLLWHLIRYTPKLALVDAGLWMLISGFFPFVPGVIIQRFFNTLTDSAPLAVSPFVLIVLLVAASLGEIATVFAGQWVRTQYRFNLRSLLRHNLLAGLLEQPGAQPLAIADRDQQAVSLGEALAYFRDDPEEIEQTIAKTADFIGEGLFALGAIALLLSINARITVLVFLPLAAIAAAVQRAQRYIKQYRRASRQATQAVTGFLGEIFASVQALKAAGAEAAVLNRLQQVNERRQHLMVKDQLLTAGLDSIFENLTNLGIGLILLLASTARGSAVGSLAVGDFALFVYYLAFVTDFFRFFGRYLALSKQTEVSFDRLASLHSGPAAIEQGEPQLISAKALVAHEPLYFASLLGHQSPLPPVEQPHWDKQSRLQELAVVNLTYRYPNAERGIEAISFSMQRGSLTAITGPIGSGKTTLLRVLLGLLPQQAGAIYWNGQLVEDPAGFFVPPRSAYTPQVPQLFSETLQNNILLGLDKPEAALRRALHLSVFEQDVAAMPEGLATLVGTRGVRLSGGQLQRAATARMLVRQPELLVFDDLSSALDVETEQKLWSRLFADRVPSARTETPRWQPTCLVVSHRPGVLRRADRILILENGKVEAMGTFDELHSSWQQDATSASNYK